MNHSTEPSSPRIICNHPLWPFVFEVDLQENVSIQPSPDHPPLTVQVIKIECEYEPDARSPKNKSQKTFYQAKITLLINGERFSLYQRAYQLPIPFLGYRWYIESIKDWAINCEVAPLPDLEKEVRLSVIEERRTWGPSLRFPILNYRWRASLYVNTWSSLVPGPFVYYHRGEDFGVLPDQLDLIAPGDGIITQTPLPEGDGKSNGWVFQLDEGLCVRYAHMNLKSFDSQFVVGTRLQKGALFAKSGATWNGTECQYADPHLHYEIDCHQSGQLTYLSPYPSIVESYLRDYPDPALPIAGGYRFGFPHQKIILDSSLSISRPDDPIIAWRWHLKNGSVIESNHAEVIYDQPGFYSETLEIETRSGFKDYDFAQIRIYDPAKSEQKGFCGWIYYHPVRNHTPNSLISFRVALWSGKLKSIDLGDGTQLTPSNHEFEYRYQRPGCYIITAHIESEEPTTLQTRIWIQSRSQNHGEFISRIF